MARGGRGTRRIRARSSGAITFVRHGRNQRQRQPRSEGRPVRRHRAGQTTSAASLDGALLRQADRQAALGAHGAHGRAEGEAPHQVHPRQLDARDRRPATSSRSSAPKGLYAYDMEGKPVWKKDLGVLDSGFFMVPEAQWGFASSPVIHDGRVIVQADVQKGSLPRGVRRDDGQGDLAHAARRRADVEHAGDLRRQAAARTSSSTAGSTSAATTSRRARRCGA